MGMFGARSSAPAVPRPVAEPGALASFHARLPSLSTLIVQLSPRPCDGSSREYLMVECGCKCPAAAEWLARYVSRAGHASTSTASQRGSDDDHPCGPSSLAAALARVTTLVLASPDDGSSVCGEASCQHLYWRR